MRAVRRPTWTDRTSSRGRGTRVCSSRGALWWCFRGLRMLERSLVAMTSSLPRCRAACAIFRQLFMAVLWLLRGPARGVAALGAVWAPFDAWSGALLSGAARRLFSPAAGRGSGVELTGGTGARVDGSSSASGPGSVTERTGGWSGCGTQFFRLLPLAVSKNPLADMAYFTGGSK